MLVVQAVRWCSCGYQAAAGGNATTFLICMLDIAVIAMNATKAAAGAATM
jgi:hypothetical protein